MVKGTWSLLSKGLLILSFLALLLCCWPFKEPVYPRDFLHVDGSHETKLKGIFVDAKSQAVRPDGKSWGTAFKTIQQGINAARSGSKIYIASGIYKNPKIELVSKHNIEIIGGYQTGDIYEKTERIFKNNEWTVLDGDQAAGNLVEITGDAHHIKFFGLRFQNVKDGSAVVIIGTLEKPIEHIRIDNCQFLDNHDLHGGGAGIFLAHTRQVEISAIYARGNCSEDTGGFIHAEDVDRLKVTSGFLVSNHAELDGGAIYIQNSSNIKISEQVMEHNHAYHGGSIAIFGSKFLQLANLVLRSNEAEGEGGALLISHSADTSILSSTFFANHALVCGGALRLQSLRGHINIDTIDFLANYSEQGGGLYFSGANLPAIITVSRSLFADNKANLAAGLLIMDTTLETTIRDITFTNNQSGRGQSPMYLNSDHEKAKFSIGPGIRYINNDAIGGLGL